MSSYETVEAEIDYSHRFAPPELPDILKSQMPTIPPPDLEAPPSLLDDLPPVPPKKEKVVRKKQKLLDITQMASAQPKGASTVPPVPPALIRHLPPVPKTRKEAFKRSASIHYDELDASKLKAKKVSGKNFQAIRSEMPNSVQMVMRRAPKNN